MLTYNPFARESRIYRVNYYHFMVDHGQVPFKNFIVVSGITIIGCDDRLIYIFIGSRCLFLSLSLSLVKQGNFSSIEIYIKSTDIPFSPILIHYLSSSRSFKSLIFENHSNTRMTNIIEYSLFQIFFFSEFRDNGSLFK